MMPGNSFVTRETVLQLLALALLAGTGCRGAANPGGGAPDDERQLPTGVRLNPIGASSALGSMPLSITLAPDRRHAVVLLGGWREQGIQIVEAATGRVSQTFELPAAFVGLAFAPDGASFYVSGGDADVVYRFRWNGQSASFADSTVLAQRGGRRLGTQYPAGLGVSPDGRRLYVAENLADSLVVIDPQSRRVVQRLPVERYPYGVAVAPDGTVYVSGWGSSSIVEFSPRADGSLAETGRHRVARHPSALLLNGDGSRLFIASGSTDRVAVFDTRARRVIAELTDTPPGGPGEGSTPNALALSLDGSRLFVAEADNNAVAVFDLSPETAGVPGPSAPANRLAGRVPVGWYPTAVASDGAQLLVTSGKGLGTGPNPDGPSPARPRTPGMRSYTLGQTTGMLTRLPLLELAEPALARHSAQVARLNRWDAVRPARHEYPPFEHVIYVIKENRTYDQVFSDLPIGDGDSTLLFFPRRISPNQHALAERFGVFDRFFVNAAVSPDGHNWSTAAYVSDYGEKTIPSQYSNRRRPYDYEGTNRGGSMAHIPEDDVNEPGNGYLWNLAERAGISFRNYGEFVTPDVHRTGTSAETAFVGNKPFLRTHTNERYPGFNLDIDDQRRVAVWLDEFAGFARTGTLPALEVVRLPSDHTSGALAGKRTPFAYMADNDLALGRMVEALSSSPYWKNTVMFVVEDDAQNGPDHVDSHRAPFLVISAYNRPGVSHRWTNTTDVIATIGDILHLGRLSQFDAFGRPLHDVFFPTPDALRYVALPANVPLDTRNPPGTQGDRESRQLDFRAEDRAEEDVFNRVLWQAIKGPGVPYPGPARLRPLELRRSR
jgi:YVTN family beta-propeller protein